jgi:hypothetical protein
MPNILATLSVSDTDPPVATIELRADGQIITPTTEIPPMAIIQLAQAVGQATNDPKAESALRRILGPVIEALQRAVDEGKAQQAAREQALTAWEPVAPPTP